MKKYIKKYIGILLILCILTTSTAIAKSDDDDGIPKDRSWVDRDKHSPKITIEDNNRHINKAEFIHYATDVDNKASSDPISTNSIGFSGSCYSTFATWGSTLPVSYVINPKNPQGLSQSFIKSAISKSAETWDAATNKELFSNTYKIDSNAKYGKFDGKNSIVFGYYPYPGVIAVTGIWYYSDTGQILEFDMLFNTIYRWGDATINPNRMDLRNIATHELGHAIGMDDQFSNSCSSVTEYGYASIGETKKRTLETPDKTGLRLLYPKTGG